MNNTFGFNQVDLTILLSQLKNPKQLTQEYTTQQICSFLNKNREYSDEIISRISEFFDKNINEISDQLFIQLITEMLKVLQHNNISITNFMNKIFPILMHIIYFCNRTMSQFNLVTGIIGSLINKCGSHASQIIESHVNTIFDKFKKEQSFKCEYTKYALISVLKEFVKNSPVIAYNKIMECYDSFNDIILNYKDPKDYIRSATQLLIQEFLMLLSNRSHEIQEDFTNRIYRLCIDANIKNNVSDPNIIHGVILVLQACMVRREFFNERYTTAMEFLNKNKNHKTQSVKLVIIDVIPYFSEYLKDVYEDNYFDTFMKFHISLFSLKPTQEMKTHLLLTFGKLSLIISSNKFRSYLNNLIQWIKLDISKNQSSFNISILSCLADWITNYSEEVIKEIPFEEISDKMFNCGFFDEHIQYWNQLIKAYDNNSTVGIKILLVILNVIAIIISDRKFLLKEAVHKLRVLENDSTLCKFDILLSQSMFLSPQSSEEPISFVNNNSIPPKYTKQNSAKDWHTYILGNKSYWNDANNSITSYIFKIKSTAKENFNSIMSKLSQNAWRFLKQISHPFFAKDILVFYQQFCVKLLESSDFQKKKMIISLATASWIPDIFNNIEKTGNSSTAFSLRKYSSSSWGNNNTNPNSIIDPELAYILNIILDSFLNFILCDQNDELKYQMLTSIDDIRYYTLLSQNNFFNKLTFVLNFGNNSIRRKVIEIIGKIIHLNYTTIIIFIKKNILEIFTKLEISTNIFEKEDSIVLMSYFVKYTGKYIVDYIQMIFSTWIKIIKNETTFDLDNSENSIFHSNEMLIISILKIINELITNEYYAQHKEIELHYEDILQICIENLKENSSAKKQEISLWTILSILEYSDKDWNIYYKYTNLVNILIQILIRSSNKKSRVYAMKIYGYIGAMDPDKWQLLATYHKIQSESTNEYYEVDEYHNYDDREMLGNATVNNNDNNRNNNTNNMKNKSSHDSNIYFQGTCMVNLSKRINFDFQQAILENDLDTCTYHAVNSLMNMWNKCNCQQEKETANKIIIVLKDIWNNWNEKDKCVVYLILPAWINSLNELEGSIISTIFEHIYFIIKNYKQCCIPFIPDWIEEVIIKNIYDKDLRKRIFDIWIKIIELFLNETEQYFPKWVPLMLDIWKEKNYANKRLYISIRKRIFTCFYYMSSKLSNYWGWIIPEMIVILYSSMNEIKYPNWYIEKEKNGNLVNNSNNLGSLPNSSLVNYLAIQSNQSTNNSDNEQVNWLMTKNKDDEIFYFIESIISHQNFSQQMPRVINILLRYMEIITVSRGKIMKLFLLMFINFRNDFLTFFPLVIRSARNCGIPTWDYFHQMKSALEKNDVLDYITKQQSVPSSRNLRKQTGDSYVDSSNSLGTVNNNSNNNNSNNTNNTISIGLSQSQKNRTRSNWMNKESILNEFNPSNCSIEEDWHEWFKSSSKSLFIQSPSYALFCCQNINDYFPPLIGELYNYAFISVWKMLNNDQKSWLISYLNLALEAPKTPPEIWLTIWNWTEFIEREENHIEFINFEKWGYVADICKAYAKAWYYVENDFRNNNDFSSFEKWITLYYDWELPESAIGILKMAKKNNQLINEEDWYLKLHQWKEALDVINKNKTSNMNLLLNENQDYCKRNFTCLDGWSDWESLLEWGDTIEKTEISQEEATDIPAKLQSSAMIKDIWITKMSPNWAKASFNLGEWDKLDHYKDKIKPSENEETYEKNFFSAVIAIKKRQYKSAQEFIENARNAIDDKIKTWLSESYQRAYKLLLSNEHLYELEEIIDWYTTHIKTSNTNQDPRYQDRPFTIDDIPWEAKEKLKKKWDSRWQWTDEDIKTYERILSIRGLVFKLDEDYYTHLKLAKICRKEDRFATCMIILNRWSKRLEHSGPNITVNVNLSISKCLNENNIQTDSLTAIDNLKKIIDNEIDKVDDRWKSKIYCYYAKWNIEREDNKLSEKNVGDILHYWELSTKYNINNYKAWHHYAMLNYKFYEIENKDTSYASNAIKGFTRSVCIGGNNISKTLQDLLRLIDIWFQVGSNEAFNKLILESFEQIAIESWLLVIPQLFARVGVSNEMIRSSLVVVLKKIGMNHPSSINYPLIVMSKSKSKIRNSAALQILSEMKSKYSNWIKECEWIIDELNRCAWLLHEQWSEAIEESAKWLFHTKDINSMIKVLKEVNEKMEQKPVTLNEVHFHQMYGSELKEAKIWMENYLSSKNEMDIKEAWDIYHSVFKNMSDNFSTLKYLDLENVSPKLFTFKESEICVPGMYKSGYQIVKITGFNKELTVWNSKQHPRKIIINGSNGKEYMFLLKGHEDLRQDERAMQWFGLVNTWLSNDPDTSDKNLFIKRFAVIPLSNNTGIIGWVQNCDTLHQLIKEYRTWNKKATNTEHRLMFANYPKFDTAKFITKLEIFKNALNNTLGLDLYKIWWKKSKNSETWWDRRTNYSRSLAVMSMVGYILGLGDRHPSNLMLDRKSGKIVHIDFGDCFEVAMKREKFPEKIPFRLTRMLIKALEVSGIEGTFRITCENVMRVLRANKDSLIAILTAFVHDPLISFRLLVPWIMKQTKKKSFTTSTTNSEQITSESLRKAKPTDQIEIKPEEIIISALTEQKNDHNDEGEIEKKRIGSDERQLYIEFEENEEIESDDLNKIAKIVLERIIDKLQGTDFNKVIQLDVKQQVDKLIYQATSHENLSQSYLGWCPYW